MIKRLYDVVVVLSPPPPPIYLQRDISRLFVLLRSFPQIRLNSSKNRDNRKKSFKIALLNLIMPRQNFNVILDQDELLLVPKYFYR